jgi:aminobenzoyl-glutamate transport protein
MATTQSVELVQRKSGFLRFIDKVETLGNKLPDPFFLFAYMLILVLILSAVFGGVSETYVLKSGAGQVTQKTVSIVNLLNVDYLRSLITDMVKTYVNFAALGLVMVLMIGIGVAQYSGLFDAAMKGTLVNANSLTLTTALAFVATCSHLASSAGIVLSTTLGAAIFSSVGRNPVKGALIGYVASHGTWSACIFPFGTDVLLSGITQTIVQAAGINAPVHPLMNYYFMFVYAFVGTFTVAFVAEKLVPDCKYGEVKNLGGQTQLTAAEKRGLKFASITLAVSVAVLLLLTVPADAFFRAKDGSLLPSSPLINGIVGILFILFVVLGSAYGYGARTITNKNQIPKLMGYGIRDMIPFFIISFTACIAINAFGDSNLGTVIAVKGANFLSVLGLGTISLAIGLVVLTCFVNLFITAVNIKWMIMGPIFVPMFAALEISPALTTLIYRVGDAIVNPISPVNLFLPIVVGIMNQYKKADDPEIGIGTLFSMTLPYVMVAAITHTLLMVIWIYFDLPMGPGVTQMLK